VRKVKFDRRLLFNFDWVFLFIILAINAIGLLNMYSAGFNILSVKAGSFCFKQSMWFLMGLLFMVVGFSLDYRSVTRYAYVFYGISLLSLVVVFAVGDVTRGTQRWLVLGPISFQPSELMKLAVVLVLAKYFAVREKEGKFSLKELAVPFLLTFVPFLLIMKQPDLGTALILIAVFVSVVLFIGVEWKALILVAITGSLLAPFSWFFLKDYQKERILTFFDPESDPLGSGYHILQSIIAVGSGGFFGKGFLKGTQSQLRFLPEHQTDFIFSVFAEEWGFVGALVLLILFLALLVWGLKIARQSRDYIGTLIAYGVTMLIFWEVVINVGMVVGFFPVVGIPLPFMSYGGSSMVVMMISVGMLMSVSMRRFILQP
jgi:rod shape determining protein RodA